MSSPLSHSQFEGLAANSRYEVIVQSKNRFGWSEPAKSFLFSTRLKGENIETQCLHL